MCRSPDKSTSSASSTSMCGLSVALGPGPYQRGGKMVVSGSPNHRYVRIQEASLETVAALMRHYAHFHPWREGIDRAPYFRRLARGLGLFFILNADEGEYQPTLSRP